MDFGRSDDPRVQAQLDRLNALSLATGRINLDTMTALMERLGNPQDRLPPVFHVAGTNGKGSTCAFLRAMLEAEGYRVHVTTSPHLVRYNERIRVAGKLIEDDRLAELLEEVFDASEGLSPSFFEVTIAVAFLEFSRVPAHACVVEVGLGGRLDATNILKPHVLAACGIAALGMDHEKFLLAPEDGVPKEPMARIAFEKAGIAKKGVPLVTLGRQYQEESRAAITTRADDVGAPLLEEGDAWYGDHGSFVAFPFQDPENELEVFLFDPTREPNCPIAGEHQAFNAGLAATMLLNQRLVSVSLEAVSKGPFLVKWPGRLQTLRDGPLMTLAPEVPIWLDGGHNRNAGDAIAEFFDTDVHLIIGMLANKDPRALIEPLGDKVRSITVVPVPNHDSHPVEVFGPDARAAANVEEALLNLPSDDYPILIAGSLYLAGEVLRLNDEIPD